MKRTRCLGFNLKGNQVIAEKKQRQLVTTEVHFSTGDTPPPRSSALRPLLCRQGLGAQRMPGLSYPRAGLMQRTKNSISIS